MQKGKAVKSSTITTPKHQHVSEDEDEDEEEEEKEEEEEEMTTIVEESAANTIEVGDPAGRPIQFNLFYTLIFIYYI